MQNNGAEMMSSCTCFWDTNNDKNIQLQWTNKTQTLKVELIVYTVKI